MEETVKQFAELVSGLKYHEWSKIKIAVEQLYSSASNKIILSDTEAVQKMIALELGINCNPQSESSRDADGSHAPDTGHGYNQI